MQKSQNKSKGGSIKESKKSGNNCSRTKSTKKGSRSSYKPYGKQKEAELNIPTSAVNLADIVDQGKNDVDWYIANRQIFEDASRLPLSWSVGSRINTAASEFWNTDVTGNTLMIQQDSMNSVPGFMIGYFIPTIGITDDGANNGINVASQKLFAKLRIDQSGGKNYEPVDTTTLVFAMSQVYLMISEWTRVYGLIKNSTPENKYTIRALIQGLGYDYDDLFTNFSNFRSALNLFIEKSANFSVPANFSFIKRWVWMVGNVHADANSEKAQLYLWQPQGYYTYNEALDTPTFEWNEYVNTMNSDGTFDLSGTVTNLPKRNLNTIKQIMSALMNPIEASSSLSLVYGDMTKTFGFDGLFKMSFVPEDYTLNPLFNDEARSQFENAVFLGTVTPEDIYQTVPEPGSNSSTFVATSIYLRQEAEYTPNSANALTPESIVAGMMKQEAIAALINNGKYILNFHKTNVTPEDIMVATRLMPILGNFQQQVVVKEGKNYVIISAAILGCGTEIATTFRMFYFDYRSLTAGLPTLKYVGGSSFQVEAPEISYAKADTFGDAVKRAALRCMLTQLDWHPTVYQYFMCTDAGAVGEFILTDNSKGGSTLGLVGVMQDTETYSMIKSDDLKPLHNEAVYAEFTNF